MTIKGYRNIESNKVGRFGTFYFQKEYTPEWIETNEVVLDFNNPLIVSQEEAEAYEGMPTEYLLELWFGDIDRKKAAQDFNLEDANMVSDACVTVEAIRRGYDGIVFVGTEICDLRTHNDYVA